MFSFTGLPDFNASKFTPSRYGDSLRKKSLIKSISVMEKTLFLKPRQTARSWKMLRVERLCPTGGMTGWAMPYLQFWVPSPQTLAKKNNGNKICHLDMKSDQNDYEYGPDCKYLKKSKNIYIFNVINTR